MVYEEIGLTKARALFEALQLVLASIESTANG